MLQLQILKVVFGSDAGSKLKIVYTNLIKHFSNEQNWLKFFNLNQFIIINGDDLLKNPGQEMEKFQKTVNIPIEITEKDFTFNENTGFYCFKKDKTGHENCLGESKGRTKGKNGKNILDADRQVLDGFYKEYNKEFYDLLNVNFGW